MNLIASKFLNECTKTNEQVKNLETNEEENQCQPKEKTLLLWDMPPTMNIF